MSLTDAVITPNGDGFQDTTTIQYLLNRDAFVSIVLKDQAGTEYRFREREPRSAGSYEAEFDGVVAVADGLATRRVMPNGRYRFTVLAEETNGATRESGGEIEIRDADTKPVEVTGLVSSLKTISPNGDGQDDDTVISYGISKDAEVVLFATDSQDRVFVLDQRTARKAALYSIYWNGTANGRVLPDGVYLVHVQAFDRSGNVSEAVEKVVLSGSGRPELKITRVEFSPSAVPLGGDLNVSIWVKNTGDTPLRTSGPPPGSAYRTDMTYNFWQAEDGVTPRYFERPGVWRVAVSHNLAGSPFPFRWGLFADEKRQLNAGEETVVTGTIRVLVRQPELRFWASVEQGGVGFPGGEVGLKVIRIGL